MLKFDKPKGTAGSLSSGENILLHMHSLLIPTFLLNKKNPATIQILYGGPFVRAKRYFHASKIGWLHFNFSGFIFFFQSLRNTFGGKYLHRAKQFLIRMKRSTLNRLRTDPVAQFPFLPKSSAVINSSFLIRAF